MKSNHNKAIIMKAINKVNNITKNLNDIYVKKNAYRKIKI